jgi:hypothetical protein
MKNKPIKLQKVSKFLTANLMVIHLLPAAVSLLDRIDEQHMYFTFLVSAFENSARGPQWL